MELRKGIGVLAAVGLLLGACGGDDSGGSLGGITDLIEGLPADERTAEQRQADGAAAAAANLTQADFPDGWDAERVVDDDEDEPLPDGMLECLGITQEQADVLEGSDDEETSAASDEFTQGDASASSEVYVYPSTETAEAQLVFFEEADFDDCFETALREQFESDPEFQELPMEISRLDIELSESPDIGDEAIQMRFELALTALGQEFSSIGDFYAVRVGRSLASVQFSNIGGPFDPALAEQLVRAVASRLTA